MMDVRELKSTTTEVRNCPVLIDRDGNIEACDEPLTVLHTHTIIGDDYGEWPEDRVYFACGHSLQEMRAGIINAEFI